ncbi:MAG: substrate-binding domain-containing protein [Thermovirgaceae bacterium]
MVNAPRQHIGMDEITPFLDDLFEPLEREETINIYESGCLGRRLLRDLASRCNVPHYQASAVDGYALIAGQTAYASPARPAKISPENTLWVNTGGWVPEPFDAVAMIEDVAESGDGSIQVSRVHSKGANIRPVGEDISMGQIITRKGERLTPCHKALLAAAGWKEVPVFPLPRVLFIPTGDEIRSIEESGLTAALEPGTVPETNSLLLSGLFDRWGYPLDIHPVLPDDPRIIEQTVQKALSDYDMVLIGAGTAKGERDHSAEIISRLGALHFRWVRMKPGRPAMLGKAFGKPLIALPGFPMSTLVTAWSVVYPLLKILEGDGPAEKHRIPEALGTREDVSTRLLAHHSSPQGISDWLRLRCAEIDGKRYSWIMPAGSSTMLSMAEADGFSLLSETDLELPKGSPVHVWIVKPVAWKKRALYQGSNDPAIERLPSYVSDRGAEMIIRSVGSLGGVMALARGEGHMAACHLLDPETRRYNTPYIETLPDAAEWERFHVFNRLQGFLVQRGNPKGLRNVEDLARENVTIVNRQSGAGTRVLLEALLAEAQISCQNVRGYETIAITHLDAAARVAANAADTALAIKAVADAMELDFIPITEEPFELFVPKRFLDHPGVAASLESFEDPAWKRDVDALGGYIWTKN